MHSFMVIDTALIKKKCLSHIDITQLIELGCTLYSDGHIKLSGKVPFVTFNIFLESKIEDS